jgi:hypothetical protein
MNSTRALKMLVVNALVVQLSLLSGCKRSPQTTLSPSSYLPAAILDLPEPVQEDHRNYLFTITWFKQPFTGYTYYLILLTNGSISPHEISQRGSKGGISGQLTPKEMREVQKILKAMRANTSSAPFEGSQVITLSFFWQGEHFTLSFNETSCPAELKQLFEIAYKAWGKSSIDASLQPCQRNEHRQQSEQEPASSDEASFSYTDLPEFVRLVHSTPMFAITWFERPFVDSYHRLWLLVDHVAADSLLEYGQGEVYGGTTAMSQLAELERLEVQNILRSLANTDSTRPPAGDTLITLSFMWEADLRAFSFGDANCPQELRRLFEIVDGAFLPRAGEPDTFQSPCK